MNQDKCADCGAVEMRFFTEAETFDYKGKLLTVDVEYSVCTQCGAEAILPEQIKRNDCRVRDAWRKADGLLTGAEIVELRKQLGLTQQEASKVFGGGANAFSKYERGEVIQSEGMDKLMRLALEKKPVQVSQWLRERAGLPVAPIEDFQNGYGDEILQLFKVKRFPPKIESANEIFIEETQETEVYRRVSYG